MRAWIVTGLLALGACASAAETAPRDMTAPIDLSTPEHAALSMMRAMYQGDAEMVDAVFLEDAILRRVTLEGEVEADGLKRWRDWVGEQSVGDADEELFDVEVEAFGDLATVWAPFMVTYQGELVGCGVNQLSMARLDGDWRIVFGMDTPAPKDTCPAFKDTYSTAE